MNNTLQSQNSGSNYSFNQNLETPRNPSSVFDLSHLITTTIDNAGLCIPIDWFLTLPNDKHDINVESLLRVLPQVVPLYSRQRLYIYTFHSRLSDLYENWQVLIKKGYSGKVTKALPTLNTNNLNGISTDTIAPNTLADYLGLPQGISQTQLDGANIQALPFMMYFRIWRDYFCNKNYYINDRIILPDDDSRFRLDDNGNLLSAGDSSKSIKFKLFGLDTKDISYDANGNIEVGLFYHDYPKDYFVSALPSPQRGDEQTIQGAFGDLDFSDSNFVKYIDEASSPRADEHVFTYFDYSEQPFVAYGDSLGTKLKTQLEKGKAKNISITLNQIRTLAIEQTVLEKLAKTDGSYAEFGLSMFGRVSKAANDYQPQLVGAISKDIAFTEVLQTSVQFDGSGDIQGTGVGTYAGHGISGINGNEGYIGHLDCDDYGICMTIACIMPDVYYSQGIEKKWTISTQDDMFLPPRAKLGMVPILNKEIYYAGNNDDDSGDDNYLWAYQNIYDEYRYIPNRVSGKIADPTSLDFFPYIQQRKFANLPNWSQGFAKANDVSKAYLQAPSEVAYTAQFKISTRSVRDLPYQAVPASLI